MYQGAVTDIRSISRKSDGFLEVIDRKIWLIDCAVSIDYSIRTIHTHTHTHHTHMFANMCCEYFHALNLYMF